MELLSPNLNTWPHLPFSVTACWYETEDQLHPLPGVRAKLPPSSVGLSFAICEMRMDPPTHSASRDEAKSQAWNLAPDGAKGPLSPCDCGHPGEQE